MALGTLPLMYFIMAGGSVHYRGPLSRKIENSRKKTLLIISRDPCWSSFMEEMDGLLLSDPQDRSDSLLFFFLRIVLGLIKHLKMAPYSLIFLSALSGNYVKTLRTHLESQMSFLSFRVCAVLHRQRRSEQNCC